MGMVVGWLFSSNLEHAWRNNTDINEQDNNSLFLLPGDLTDTQQTNFGNTPWWRWGGSVTWEGSAVFGGPSVEI